MEHKYGIEVIRPGGQRFEWDLHGEQFSYAVANNTYFGLLKMLKALGVPNFRVVWYDNYGMPDQGVYKEHVEETPESELPLKPLSENWGTLYSHCSGDLGTTIGMTYSEAQQHAEELRTDHQNLDFVDVIYVVNHKQQSTTPSTRDGACNSLL